MAEIYACICSNVVESSARVQSSNSAMRCGLTDAKRLGNIIHNVYFQFGINLNIFVVSSSILRASSSIHPRSEELAL
jgi:hypothetical protein